MIKTIGHKLATPIALGTALAAALAMSGTAQASDAYSGHWQFKVLATAVLPSGSLASVTDNAGTIATDPGDPLSGLTTAANNNVTPTIAVEYFFKPSFSVETIAGITSHHVYATGPDGLVGVSAVDHAQVIPFTLTAKYHFVGLLPYGIKPYVGAGPTLFAWINDRPAPPCAIWV